MSSHNVNQLSLELSVGQIEYRSPVLFVLGSGCVAGVL
jgi:hypothetical protein